MQILDISADLMQYRSKHLRRGEWLIGRRVATNYITLHWNGPAVKHTLRGGDGAIQQLRADLVWQTRPGWAGVRSGADGLQYHAAVDAEGRILICRNLDARLWHCGNATGNRESLSLHLLLGRGQSATTAQWQATEELLTLWRADYSIPLEHVVGHNTWKPTECPGPDISRRLSSYRRDAPDQPARLVVSRSPYGVSRYVINLPAECRATVRSGPGRNHPIVGHLRPGARIWVDVVVPDELGETIDGHTEWVHMARVPDAQPDLGFVHRSAVEAE